MSLMDAPYVYQGVAYKTAENFYQAMKLPKDRVDLRAEIAEMTSYESKTAIRNRTKYRWRDDWEVDKLAVMEQVLRVKFAKHTSWGKKLSETPGDIVENNNWHDNYWGDCNCEKCKQIPGLNHLGKILMKIREEIK